MFKIGSMNMVIVTTLFWGMQGSLAIPSHPIAPKPSRTALKIVEAHMGGLREKIIQDLRDPKILSQLRGWGIEKNEVEMVLFSLSDRELYTLQKVFSLSVVEGVKNGGEFAPKY